MRLKVLILMSLVITSGCARRKIEPVCPASIKNSSFFDVSSQDHQASYIYAPGLMGSEIIMGRLCPHFVASTGEQISWQVGGNVIGRPHTAVIFPEVDLNKPRGFTLNPLKIIFNGIRRDLFPLAERFFSEKYGINVIDNPNSSKTVANYSFNFSRANIGQRQDIKALQKTYAQHIQKYPSTDIVLYGDSRGAATIFNFIAIYKPTRVKAAVVEGIFDSVPHLMKHFMFNNKESYTEKRLNGILSFVMGSYKKKAMSPRDYAEIITDDIPLLLVTSLQDWIVPPQCTLYLYNRLKERGHQKIHILVLKHSSHPGYMLDNPDDKELYESVVHAFYKKYNLPYNQAKAQAGQKAFAVTQPSLAEISSTYELPSCPLCFK